MDPWGQGVNGAASDSQFPCLWLREGTRGDSPEQQILPALVTKHHSPITPSGSRTRTVGVLAQHRVTPGCLQLVVEVPSQVLHPH